MRSMTRRRFPCAPLRTMNAAAMKSMHSASSMALRELLAKPRLVLGVHRHRRAAERRKPPVHPGLHPPSTPAATSTRRRCQSLVPPLLPLLRFFFFFAASGVAPSPPPPPPPPPADEPAKGDEGSVYQFNMSLGGLKLRLWRRFRVVDSK